METVLLLVLLGCVSFIQNMMFTWTSRSRNSGDPDYHRFASWGSNGVWFLAQMFIVKLMWEPLMKGDWAIVAIGGLIYIAATTEGSVFMMRILLGKVPWLPKWLSRLLVEQGKRKVGEV